MSEGRDGQFETPPPGDLARVALVVGLVAVAAFAASFAGARPLNEIPVTDVGQAEADALAEPTAGAWGTVTPVEMPLTPAPSGAPAAEDVSVEAVTMRAARTDERLYLRLSWRDGSADRTGTIQDPIQGFGDGVAVQLPLNTSERPGIAMGSERSMVNVWYWNGETGGQEVLAGGPGTVTPLGDAAVSTNATYRDGRWYVVFSRARTATTESRTPLAIEDDLPVAVAVWNGSNGERAGRKAVSEWHHFAGPERGAATYEAVLWTIAGLAIVIVVAVSVGAIRRGGGG